MCCSLQFTFVVCLPLNINLPFAIFFCFFFLDSSLEIVNCAKCMIYMIILIMIFTSILMQYFLVLWIDGAQWFKNLNWRQYFWFLNIGFITTTRVYQIVYLKIFHFILQFKLFRVFFKKRLIFDFLISVK